VLQFGNDNADPDLVGLGERDALENLSVEEREEWLAL
jgi:hypothetical protein